MWSLIIGILVLLWGISMIAIALSKPKKVWETGKIQGFVKLLGEKGAAVFFIVIGIIALGLGIWLIL